MYSPLGLVARSLVSTLVSLIDPPSRESPPLLASLVSSIISSLYYNLYSILSSKSSQVQLAATISTIRSFPSTIVVSFLDIGYYFFLGKRQSYLRCPFLLQLQQVILLKRDQFVCQIALISIGPIQVPNEVDIAGFFLPFLLLLLLLKVCRLLFFFYYFYIYRQLSIYIAISIYSSSIVGWSRWYSSSLTSSLRPLQKSYIKPLSLILACSESYWN